MNEPDDRSKEAPSEAQLRDGESKYRSILDSLDTGYCVLEVLFDDGGEPVDYRFLEVNPAFVDQTGMVGAVGRRMRSLAPEHEQFWFDTYGRIARTGQPERFEHRADALGRWYSVYAFRIGNPDQHQVAVLFEDIKDRRRAELALQRSEERQAYLLQLSDALRPLTDAVEIIGAATRLLGQGLGASRAFYAEWPPGTDYVEIRSDYAAPGLPSLVGRYPIEFFRYTDGRFREGRTWVIQDAADGTIPAAERDYCLAHGVAAWVNVPLVKGGKLQAALFLVQDAPRCWNATEIALVEETAERTWAALERARAEAALRESEEKYRTLFDTIDSGYALTDNVRDEERRVVDLFGVDFNRSYTQHSGLPPFAGRRASEVITVQPEWLRQFEEVTRTGVPARHENYIAERDRWVSTHYSLVGDLGSDRVAVVFDDITDRKRAEQALRESEERQAFLLALGDAMRAESAADGKIAVAARLLGEKLNVSRVLYAEYDHEKGLAYIFKGWLADGAEPIPAVVKLDDFEGEVLSDLRSGRVVRVDDVGRLDAESGYAAIANLGVQALLSPPLLVGGKLKFNVSVHQDEPRHWTDDEVALVQEVSERLWTEIVRARAERALRDSEERLRLIVESARDYAIFTIDGERNIREWLPGAEAVFGYNREEAEGRSADMLFTAEDRERGAPAKEVETARREGQAPDVRWHVRKSGERVFIEGQVVPLRDGGDAEGFLKIGRDVTHQRAAEQALRESEERFRQFGEASSDLLWIRDAETLAFEYLSPAFEQLYGAPREQVLEQNNVEGWLQLIHPDDREQAIAALRRLREGGVSKLEFRVQRPDGSYCWIQNTDFPMFDTDGKVQRIAGIAQDVTERKRAIEMQGTLLAELQHRVRNVLALIRSIVRRTRGSKTDLTEFVQHLEGRIDAMARTQALLTRAPGRGVDLEEVLRDEMLAQGAADGKYSVRGPAVALSPHAAEVLTLALHELATNSVKYGALGQSEGHIAVSWKCKGAKGQRQLTLSWHETGLPPSRGSGEGFGTELITHRVPYELNGVGALDFADRALTATIEFPLEQKHSILETEPNGG